MSWALLWAFLHAGLLLFRPLPEFGRLSRTEPAGRSLVACVFVDKLHALAKEATACPTLNWYSGLEMRERFAAEFPDAIQPLQTCVASQPNADMLAIHLPLQQWSPGRYLDLPM